MEDEKYWLLMSRYLSNELTLEETTELLNWIEENPERTELLQQLQTAWDKTAIYKQEPAHFNADTAWPKVAERLVEVPKAAHKAQKSYFWLRVAAMLLIAVNVGWFAFKYYDNRIPVEVINNTDKVKLVKLPDNSKVWLNTSSKISYKKGISSLPKREVVLVGEAFFDVNRNPEQAFTVKTSATETEVLGTSFNVKGDGSVVQVSVLTGTVSFKTESEDKKLVLLAGEIGVFNGLALQKAKVANSNYLYWKNKEISFHNERLENVIADIEKSYKVRFEVENKRLLDERITATFKNAPIEEVQSVLEALLERPIVQSVNSYVVK